MADDFKPIETQEALNAIIKDRIERAQEAVRKEYAGYEDLKAKADQYDQLEAGYKAQIDALSTDIQTRDASIADLNGKISTYETAAVKSRLADEFHLASGLADFISGSDEAQMRASAEKLAGLTRIQDFPKDVSAPAPDGKNADLLRMSRELRG